MNEPTTFEVLRSVLLLLLVITIPIYFIWKKGTQNALNAKEYNRRYILIDTLLNNLPDNETNHDYISRLMEGFRLMKHKDQTRTLKLIDKFNTKFEKEASRIMKEHQKIE